MSDFNPRSREGSDLFRRFHILWTAIFQSTLPRRERLFRAKVIRVTINISIHAPAKGATTSNDRNVITKVDFNPRSREGSDNVMLNIAACISDFNPRSREGSDEPGIWRIRTAGDFNPRSREGATVLHNPERVCIQISIHAPAKGAT